MTDLQHIPASIAVSKIESAIRQRQWRYHLGLRCLE
jgi:hypothetical protein